MDDSNYWPYEESSSEEEEEEEPLPPGWEETKGACNMPLFVNKSLNVATYIRPKPETAAEVQAQQEKAKAEQKSSAPQQPTQPPAAPAQPPPALRQP